MIINANGAMRAMLLLTLASQLQAGGAVAQTTAPTASAAPANVAPTAARTPAPFDPVMDTKVAVGITLDQAATGVAGALAKCAKSPIAVAVVDKDGNLRMLQSREGGRVLFSDLAWRKARTAAHFKEPSSVTGKRGLSDGMTFWLLSPSIYSFYGGGLPIHAKDGGVIGGFAVSGGRNPEEDEICAIHGLAALEAAIKAAG